MRHSSSSRALTPWCPRLPEQLSPSQRSQSPLLTSLPLCSDSPHHQKGAPAGAVSGGSVVNRRNPRRFAAALVVHASAHHGYRSPRGSLLGGLIRLHPLRTPTSERDHGSTGCFSSTARFGSLPVCVWRLPLPLLSATPKLSAYPNTHVRLGPRLPPFVGRSEQMQQHPRPVGDGTS